MMVFQTLELPVPRSPHRTLGKTSAHLGFPRLPSPQAQMKVLVAHRISCFRIIHTVNVNDRGTPAS